MLKAIKSKLKKLCKNSAQFTHSIITEPENHIIVIASSVVVMIICTLLATIAAVTA